MKDIRIGNDIIVKWSIFGDGAPYILEGKDVSLYLCTPFGKRKAEGFSIVGNQITWTFAGKDQSRTGKYSLELVVNADKEGQVTTDVCNFVNLVNCSCKVGGTDESNVEIESISLTSELGFLPYDDAELREAIATLERKKVDKEEGKGLSKNDYTDEEKKKNVVASFLNGASLQGLPFGYIGGTYQSYQLDGEVNEEIDLGVIKEAYYGNIAFSYEDKLYEFKIADLKSEGSTLGTILVRVTDDYHLIVKPFAPRVALLGWRTYGDRTKMPSAWVEGGGSGGGSYDDTGIKKDISDLKANDALQDAELAKLSERVGDLEEEGKPIFKAVFGETAIEEIVEAYNSGKIVHCDYNGLCYTLSRISNGVAYLSANIGMITYRLRCSENSVWDNQTYQLEQTTNKVTSLSDKSTDTQYPSAKAVYDALQNLGGGSSGGDDTSLREAIFGKTTSKEFAINGYHAPTADTLEVNVAQGEVFHVKLETLGADLKKIQLYVKYEGDSEQTTLLYFSQNMVYSFFAVRPIVELGVNASSGWVITKGQVRLSITQGGMTLPHNYMNLGEIIMPENASELNVLEYIPHLLRFKDIKVYALFSYSDSREKKGYISLNSENLGSIVIENLFGTVTDTAYIFDILLDSNSITGFIECHSNSFGNPQKSDTNQGKNFGKLAMGNPINEFIIKLPLLAGDKFTFYGK